MTPRPHDALFKSAFEAPADAAALLRELLPPAVRAAVIWKTLDRERGSFIDKKLADRHNDLLFRARLKTRKRTLVYFLLEHQSTSDPAMPQRTLSYASRLWDRFVKKHPKARLAPVIAVLISHVLGGWKAARAFEELFDPEVMAIAGLPTLVPRFSMIVEDLTQRSDPDLAARPLGAFQKLALWLLRDARDSARLLDSFDPWIPTMLALRRTRSGLDSLEVLITYMYQVIDPMKQEELRAKIRKCDARAQEVAMTIADYLRKEGLKEGHKRGRKRGRKEGLKEGRIATLRSLLTLKFQTVDPEYETRLRAATPEAIDRYLGRLFTAESLAELFAD
jgi:predicted transposase/invertase (TIGR01784 family)